MYSDWLQSLYAYGVEATTVRGRMAPENIPTYVVPFNPVFICGATSYVGRTGSVSSGANVAWTFSGISNAIDNTMFTTTKTVKIGEKIDFWIDDPIKLVTFDIHSNSLYGIMPDVSACTGLHVISVATNHLSGNIPSLTTNTALTEVYFNNCSFSGSIPDLSANVLLAECYFGFNSLTGTIPSISSNVALLDFDVEHNQLTGNIPDLSSNVLLGFAGFNDNLLTGFSGGVPASLGYFDASNNHLTQAAVDAILLAFVTANRPHQLGDTISIGGTGNAAPSAAGLASKATLVSRGWTVTTN